jgi:predicted Fe-Mo cluster-binding NifX family protein
MSSFPTAQQTTQYIQQQFGTVNRFADIAALDQTAVRNTLKRVPGQAVRALLETAQQLKKEKPDAVASWEISPADVLALKQHVQRQHGGNLSAFCRQHGLDVITTDQITRGNRKRKTAPVIDAMKAAKVSGY